MAHAVASLRNGSPPLAGNPPSGNARDSSNLIALLNCESFNDKGSTQARDVSRFTFHDMAFRNLLVTSQRREQRPGNLYPCRSDDDHKHTWEDEKY